MLRPGIRIAVTVLVVIAFAHFLRLAFLIPMSAGEWQPAQWLSLLGVILPLVVAGLLMLERDEHGQR